MEYSFLVGMFVKPLRYYNHLTSNELRQYECSDGIWCSQNTYTAIKTAHAMDILIIKLTNANGQSAVGTLSHIHTDENAEDRLYVPQWMYELINSHESIVITPYIAPLCIFFRIQPHGYIPPIRDAIMNAFIYYTCIRSNSMVQLWMGEPYTVTIRDVSPISDYVILRNSLATADVLIPDALPTILPEPASFLIPYKQQQPIYTYTPFSGTAYRCGDNQSSKPQHECIRDAVQRRYIKNKQDME